MKRQTTSRRGWLIKKTFVRCFSLPIPTTAETSSSTYCNNMQARARALKAEDVVFISSLSRLRSFRAFSTVAPRKTVRRWRRQKFSRLICRVINGRKFQRPRSFLFAPPSNWKSAAAVTTRQVSSARAWLSRENRTAGADEGVCRHKKYNKKKKNTKYKHVSPTRSAWWIDFVSGARDVNNYWPCSYNLSSAVLRHSPLPQPLYTSRSFFVFDKSRLSARSACLRRATQTRKPDMNRTVLHTNNECAYQINAVDVYHEHNMETFLSTQ